MQTIECPHCNKRLKYRDSLAGQQARCQRCRRTLVLPEEPTRDEREPVSRRAWHKPDRPTHRTNVLLVAVTAGILAGIAGRVAGVALCLSVGADMDFWADALGFAAALSAALGAAI